MNILIIIIVMGVMLSPLLMLRVSSKQKNSMQNRQHARRLGLSMQMVKLEAPNWLSNAPVMCMQYYLGHQEKDGDVNYPEWEFWQITPQKWVDKWQDECPKDIKEMLSKLPNCIYKVILNKQLVATYLDDSFKDDNQESINKIAAFLQKYA